MSTLLRNIRQLVTPAGNGPVTEPLRGDAMRVTVVEDAAILLRDGAIEWVGPESEAPGATDELDAGGAIALPGMVDCHAHLVFAGDRAIDFELRNLGASYEQLHSEGRGINYTVEQTRAAIDDESIDSRVAAHLDWLLQAGTTTCEGKTGYGLSSEHEQASLQTLGWFTDEHPIDLLPTLLAAHTVPVEYTGNADGYIDDVAIPLLDEPGTVDTALAADVFLERGSFNREQAERYLRAAKDAGLDLRLHSDQFSDQGGIDLAIELGAKSVDHLEALEADAPRLTRLAESDVAGVLLPLSSLFLRRPYAPGRALVDAGALVAVASDFNPGSSYGESMFLAMSLACMGCGLRIEEALVAATANAAWVLGMENDVGRLASGYQADIVLLDQPDWRHAAYHVGSPRVQTVIKGGRVVAGDPM